MLVTVLPTPPSPSESRAPGFDTGPVQGDPRRAWCIFVLAANEAGGNACRKWGMLTCSLLFMVLVFIAAAASAPVGIGVTGLAAVQVAEGAAPAGDGAGFSAVEAQLPGLAVVRTAQDDAATEQAAWAVATSAATGPVTIANSLQVTGDRLEGSLRRLWLAALSDAPSGPGNLMALAVVPRTRGWLTVWELQLQAPALDRTLGTVVLQAGHRYDTILAFDPASGRAGVRIADGTTGAVVYQGQFEVSPVDGPVYAAVGLAVSAGAASPVRLTVDAFSVEPGYAPVGAAWRLARSVDGVPGPDQVSHIGAEPVGLWIAGTHAAGAGEFRLGVATEAGRTVILTLPPAGGERFIPIPPEAFPPGPFDLVMEFVSGDRTLFSEKRRVVAGRIHVDFGRVLPDLAAGRATSAAAIRAEGPSSGVRLRIEAERARLIWDEQARTYVEIPEGRELLVDGLAPGPEASPGRGGALVVPLSLPLRSGEPGLWRVRFIATADVAVPISASGDVRLFSTYPPAAAEAEGPFAIAVLPDTQKYVRNYPHIFTRQAEWIAANAARLNTAFVLHLGDITDNNAAEQWQLARQSMGVLDGAVPYVLAVGNHDMGNNGSADTRATRLGEFFPWDEISREPWFGGSFEPGRLENSYYIFQAGGASWLVLALEFGPRDEVLEWANEIVAAHPERRVIVVTHTYTTTSGGRLAGGNASPESYPFARLPGASANDGYGVWRKFVRHHPNIFLVLSGHIAHDGMPRQVSRGDHGNAVYEILMDYQHLEWGGSGWLGLLQVDLKAGEVVVQGVSPYLNECKVGNFGGFGVPFVIDLEAEAFRRADPVAVAFGLERGRQREVACAVNPS